LAKEIIINSTVNETRVAVLDNNSLAEIFLERAKNKGIAGNIYKGKVVKVLPGMQSAFVDIGHDRAAFCMLVICILMIWTTFLYSKIESLK